MSNNTAAPIRVNLIGEFVVRCKICGTVVYKERFNDSKNIRERKILVNAPFALFKYWKRVPDGVVADLKCCATE